MENETTGSLAMDIDGNLIDLKLIETEFQIIDGIVTTGTTE